MPNWTKEQYEAIITKGSNLLVSAAAGSGKTAVLVERIIKIVTEDLVDIDRLLIVTFTNAAAGEMRERIQKALTDKLNSDCENEEHIRRQLTLLNKASIATLHSFCIDVVRKNFHKLGIDPSFRIGNATEKEILIRDIIDDIMEKEYENGDDNFYKLVESYGGVKDDSKIRELILKLFYFIQSKPYPLKWLSEAIEMFNISNEDYNYNQWILTIKEDVKTELKGAIELINESIILCNEVNGPIEYEDTLTNDLDIMSSLIHDLSIDLDLFNNNLNSIKFKRIPTIKKDRKSEVDERIVTEIKNNRDYYKKKIIEPLKTKFGTKSIVEHFDNISELYPMMCHLFSIIERFQNLYKESKFEKGILDFNDLEHYALQILDDNNISDIFKNKFEYVFVDEYQDSNLVQETIVNRIKRDNNLFLVGDVKQSIYKFRMADPSLFIEKYEKYKLGEGLNRKIILSKNFRSRFEILQGVNYIFKNIMSKEFGEIDYDEEAYLYKGLDFEPIDDSSIEVNIIEQNMNDIDDIDEELKELNNIEIEAKFITKRIKEIIGSETYSPKSKSYKKIDYKDIVILLRTTKNWASVFAEVLSKDGIPVYSEDNAGFLDSIEIKIFMNLLALIDNKNQDIPLLSVMRSSIGKFNIEELINIRLMYKNLSYYNAIKNYIKDNNDDLQKKLNKFITLLNALSEDVRCLKLSDFIWKAAIETGFYNYIGSMPRGSQRQANLRILIERAEEFENSTYKGLFNFISFIKKFNKSGGELSPAKILSENDNVVRLMSIHKSKGLEFPVVILAGLGKQFNLMDTKEDILLHKELGLGPKYVDIDNRTFSQTLPQIAIKRKIKLESLSEEMRILYVALTRPVDKLILLGSVKRLDKQCEKWAKKNTIYNLINSKCYLDWVMSCVSKHKDGFKIRDIAGLDDNCFINSDSSKWSINIIDIREIFNEEKVLDERKELLKEKLYNFTLENKTELYNSIKERLRWNYYYSDAVGIPSKVSVSDLKEATFENINNINYKIPSLSKTPIFLEEIKEFSNSEKGTIIHFTMQHLDLSNIKDYESIKIQIDDLVQRELLTEDEANVISIDKILNFFSSLIGKRMLSVNEVNREVPFVLTKKAKDVIDGIGECEDSLLIQGIIDCYFEEDNEIVLIDYKTDNISEEKEFINRYKKQIYYYKHALESISGKKVKECYIYSFNLNREIQID